MPGVIISDGTSRAYVDDNAVRARQHDEYEVALAAGDVYSWCATTYDYDALDSIIGVENNSATKDLYIYRVIVSSDTLTEVVVHASSGHTPTGTAITGVNLNRNYATLVAPATAKRDETGQTEQGDTPTYPGRLWIGRVPADTPLVIEVDGAIILPNDHMICVDLTDAGTGCSSTIIGYFK